MSNYHDSPGNNIKRVWIRVKNTWVTIPTGALENPTLRSLNIYDGDNWWIPTWGRLYERAHLNVYPRRNPTLYLRAPGKTWDVNDTVNRLPGNSLDHYNPNFLVQDSADRFDIERQNWVALNPIERKRESRWRIVALNTPIPVTPPSATVAGTAWFWPAYSTYRQGEKFDTATQALIPYEDVQAPAQGESSRAPQLYDAVHRREIVLANWTTIRVRPGTRRPDDYSLYPGYHLHQDEGTFRDATTIDLGAIRGRLNDHYPERGIDMVGQYQHIRSMVLRRIVLLVFVTFDGWIEVPQRSFYAGHARLLEVLAKFRFRIFMQIDGQVVAEQLYSPDWGVTANLLRTATPGVRLGDQVYEKPVQDPQDPVFWDDPNPQNSDLSIPHWQIRANGDVRYYLDVPRVVGPLSWSWDNTQLRDGAPVTFHCVVEEADLPDIQTDPSTQAAPISAFGLTATCTSLYSVLHYSTPDTDTPYESHTDPQSYYY